MNIDHRIKALATLGKFFATISKDELQSLATGAANENPWFTPESVELAIRSVAKNLTETSLSEWIAPYKLSSSELTIGIVAAGNIPLVAFHDLLSVLICGHTALIKLSSKDTFLMNFVITKLKEIEPAFGDRIVVAEQLKNFNAVIATGSDNTSRYFEFYFGKYPNIIRKNRTSVAILSGDETDAELTALGHDVFSYFGLGCRNISKLFVPEDYEFDRMFRSWEPYQPIIHHHKYCNNYDYQKSILLVDSQAFLDNGFVLLRESEKIVSPISVMYSERYRDEKELSEKLHGASGKIQVIEGNSHLASITFGKSQLPQLNDYADNVDTIRFLCDLQ